jgi:hypothetical protein
MNWMKNAKQSVHPKESRPEGKQHAFFSQHRSTGTVPPISAVNGRVVRWLRSGGSWLSAADQHDAPSSQHWHLKQSHIIWLHLFLVYVYVVVQARRLPSSIGSSAPEDESLSTTLQPANRPQSFIAAFSANRNKSQFLTSPTASSGTASSHTSQAALDRVLSEPRRDESLQFLHRACLLPESVGPSGTDGHFT